TGSERWLLRPSDVPSETKFNQPTSMRLLTEAGLISAADFSTEIPLLGSDKALRNVLTNNGSTSTWFWTARQGLGRKEGVTGSGVLYTLGSDGRFHNGNGESIEDTTRVWSGNHPVCLDVHSDVYAAFDGRRFGLGAYVGPLYVAPVVWGVRPGHEVAAPKLKIPAELFRSAQAEV